MRRDPEVEALRERIDELEAEAEKLREKLRGAKSDAKGWQAEWTKTRKREQRLRRVVAAALSFVDDDEWYTEAELALADTEAVPLPEEPKP